MNRQYEQLTLFSEDFPVRRTISCGRPTPAKGGSIRFEKVEDRLRSKGLPYEWIYKIVEPEEPGAVFIKKGIPFERSDCPEYEGIWLCGGFSSVQCSTHNGLLPGMMWDEICGKDPERCPFRK